MTTSIRTRFAPSPTGYLHIGGARTALFSWLFARHHGGQFVLRIEDTDQERSTEESIQAILDAMDWLQLDYDEGPFYQTERFDRYKQVIEQLLAEGKAYRCTCSKERLTQLRETQMKNKEKPRYDGHCRDKHLQAGDEPFVIRFKNPEAGDVVFHDLVRGEICVSNTELDDLIIARTDGTPTYNFTVVVDDWEMKITHVVRGDDHINNTPRQINILKALGADVPKYAHVPMILGGDGKRLSKRHGAVSVTEFAKQGILPQAMLNCLVRLGWSHGDQELFSVDEMVRYFDLDHVNNSPAAFTDEKLLWFNQQYMKQLDPSELVKGVEQQLDELGLHADRGPALTDVISVQVDRCKTLKEIAEKSIFFYSDDIEYDEKAVKKNIKPETLPILESMKMQFESLGSWEKEALHEVIIKTAESHDLKLGKVAQPLRVAVTGGTVSPSMDVTLELIGRERVLARLSHIKNV